jgi:hypothetical protein
MLAHVYIAQEATELIAVIISQYGHTTACDVLLVWFSRRIQVFVRLGIALHPEGLQAL